MPVLSLVGEIKPELLLIFEIGADLSPGTDGPVHVSQILMQ